MSGKWNNWMIVPGNLYHLLQSFSSSNTNTLNDNNCCSYVFDVLKQMNMLPKDVIWAISNHDNALIWVT